MAFLLRDKLFEGTNFYLFGSLHYVSRTVYDLVGHSVCIKGVKRGDTYNLKY